MVQFTLRKISKKHIRLIRALFDAEAAPVDKSDADPWKLMSEGQAD
jgi:hypothetical protein